MHSSFSERAQILYTEVLVIAKNESDVYNLNEFITLSVLNIILFKTISIIP